MQKRCYEIHLPLTLNDGRPVDPQMFVLTQDELVAQFGALSFHPQPVRGIWVHSGKRYEDELLRISVDVDDTPENRQFFTTLKLKLRERFQQIEIYIRSYLIDIV